MSSPGIPGVLRSIPALQHKASEAGINEDRMATTITRVWLYLIFHWRRVGTIADEVAFESSIFIQNSRVLGAEPKKTR
jgi:hypothetical protein